MKYIFIAAILAVVAIFISNMPPSPNTLNTKAAAEIDKYLSEKRDSFPGTLAHIKIQSWDQFPLFDKKDADTYVTMDFGAYISGNVILLETTTKKMSWNFSIDNFQLAKDLQFDTSKEPEMIAWLIRHPHNKLDLTLVDTKRKLMLVHQKEFSDVAHVLTFLNSLPRELPWYLKSMSQFTTPEEISIFELETPNKSFGKVLPINTKTNNVDPIIFGFDKTLLPQTPEGADTLAFLTWDNRYVGALTEHGHGAIYGGTMYRIVCNIIFVDRKSGKQIWNTNLKGSEPWGISNQPGDQYGSNPATEIVEYFKNFPEE